jgi:hypothetical protein
MKKKTQTLLPILSTLLLMASISVSANAQTPSTHEFTGVWNTVTEKGKKIRLNLQQVRVGTVTGTYAPNALSASYKPADRSTFSFVKASASTATPSIQNMSSIRGRLKDNVLRFYWNEDGGSGAGRFTLSADGNSFQGTLSGNGNPDDTSGGTWNGTRVHSFAGAWHGKLGDGFLELVLQQSGDQVTGLFRLNSAEHLVRYGTIDGNNKLRFTILRPGTHIGGGRFSPDTPIGTGELVLDAAGKSFTGTALGVSTTGNLIAR